MARDRHLHHEGEERRQDGQDDGDHEEDRPGAAAVVAVATSDAEEGRAQEEVGDQGDHADQHADEHGEADVEVAHVRHLVGHDALELVAAHHLQQPGRHRHRSVLGVPTRGEGVGGRVVDDVDGRHGDAGGDRHLLDHVPEDRRLLAGDTLGPAGGEDDVRAAVVTDQAPDDGHDAEDAEQPETRGVGAKVGDTDGEAEREQHQDDDRHQEDRVALVAGDLFVHGSGRPPLYCPGCWGGLGG